VRQTFGLVRNSHFGTCATLPGESVEQ